jgi:signal transduction histidine kinase
MSDTAKQKKITIINKIPENLDIYADSHMLQTIYRNLLSNALKFTEKGGVIRLSVTQSTEQTTIFVVKDSGIGINSELKEKLFNIDFNNKTRGTEGELSTGLGLILCKEFIEKHGGKIWVDSEQGRGSAFYFTLEKYQN